MEKDGANCVTAEFFVSRQKTQYKAVGRYIALVRNGDRELVNLFNFIFILVA
jgi:hypothetical protein